MTNDTRSIHVYFSKLGFSSEIADIYLALYAHGKQTVSELARNSGVERTRIYRLVDELKASGLVEVEARYKKSIFAAAPLSNLQSLLSKKEQELYDLRGDLFDLQQLFIDRSSSSPTKVQTYKGPEGMKQMFWNQTRSTTGNLSLLYENMQSRTNLVFFERWTQAMEEKNIPSRSLIGDHFIQSQQEWYKKHKNERLKKWEGRYIAPTVFAITHSVVIFNDVTAYINWKDGEIFGVEIYNQEIADAQRQFFEILWNQGIRIDDLKFEVDAVERE